MQVAAMIQVGLVDTTGALDPSYLAEVARALTQQANQFAPIWGVTASVSVLPDNNRVPLNVWPIFLVDSLPPGEGGVHSDQADQPYSLVIALPSDPTWSLDASHELLEMLADPQGSRTIAAPAITVANGHIQGAPGRVKYLIEVCDPVEAEQCSYELDGIMVSDFIMPDFYDATIMSGKSYSYKGRLTKPLSLYPGGYISWMDPITGGWSQILWVDTSNPPQLNTLGKFSSSGSVRSWVDSKTPRHRRPDPTKRAEHVFHRHHVQNAAIANRKLYPV